MVGADIPTPSSYRPDISNLPVNNQRLIPACGAHAGVTLKQIQDGGNLSPRYLWRYIKLIDGFKPEEGTSIYAILKTLLNKGTCTDTLCPNDTTLSLQNYTYFTPSREMDLDAENHKIQSYATVDHPTFDQLKKAIYVNKAVIMLLRVGANMYRPSYSATDILPLNPTRYTLDSGHFMTAYGYDEQYIYFRNEWGDTWALKGDGYLGSDYVPYIQAIGTAVDQINVTPAVVPMTPWQIFWSKLKLAHVGWNDVTKQWQYI